MEKEIVVNIIFIAMSFGIGIVIGSMITDSLNDSYHKNKLINHNLGYYLVDPKTGITKFVYKTLKKKSKCKSISKPKI